MRSSSMVLLFGLAAGPAALLAQTDAAPAVLASDRAVCRSELHAWADGGPHRALTGYGTFVAPRFAAGPSDGSVAGAIGADLAGYRGPVLAGTPVRSESGGFVYPGPTSDSRDAQGLRVRIDVERGPLLLSADWTQLQDDVRRRVLIGGVRMRAVTVLAGAVPLRSGTGCGGGLVLAGSPGASAWAAELRQRAPFRLPGLGEIRFGVQLGAMREGGPGNDWPLFHSMRVELGPYGDDWVVGLNRAVIFGGSGSRVPITARTIAQMFVGLTTVPGKDSQFENQVASVDLRGRVRVSGVPALLTAEYGTDDSGWAFVHVPGVRVAAELLGGERLGWVGLEGAILRPRTRGYPSWYTHHGLLWGWTDRGRLLGNFLGGEGKSLLVTLRREGAHVAYDLAGGVVERGGANLFSPDLMGTGLRVSASILVASRGWEWAVDASADQAGSFAGQLSTSLLRRFGGGAP